MRKNETPPEDGGKKEDQKILELLYAKNDAEERLYTLQKENRALKENSQLFKEDFQHKIEEQEEIILFLEKTVNDLKKKQKALQKEYENQEKEKNEADVAFKKKERETKADYDKLIKGLEERMRKLKKKLDDLHDFQAHKEVVESELTKVKADLKNEKSDREQKEAFLERRFLSERERLKKEMLRKIRETKLRLLAMTEDQLHTTTKRTIMENEQMTIELQYQSKETEKLLTQVEQVKSENRQLQRQIELHQKTEKMLATRTHFLQRLVDQFNDQKKKEENRLNAEKDHNRELQEQQKFHKNEELRQAKVYARKECQSQIKSQSLEIKRLKSEVMRSHDRLNSLLQIQDDSITFIWTCLESVRAELQEEAGNAKTTEDQSRVLLSTLDKTQRERVLKKLFSKLNAFKGEALDWLLYDDPERSLKRNIETGTKKPSGPL